MQHLKKNWIRLFTCFALTALLCSSADASRRQTVITGKTMGTYYTIKFISRRQEKSSVWKERIDIELKQVNQTMSMYDPKSELSRFNRRPTNDPFPVSKDFKTLLQQARQIYELTNGAWDGTVKPLVDLWGFGVKKRKNQIPDESLIREKLSIVGFNKIIFQDKNLLKTGPISLDLGSIAKGYGVDAVLKMFQEFGIEDCLVEVGGELSASGKNLKNHSWAVGISRPVKKMTDQTLYRVINLKNNAIATSGNYRNFFEIKDRTFSHIIDPRTGYPTNNKIVSASVVHPSCSFADGLATALMVMPVHESLALVNQLEDTECLIIKKDTDGFHSFESDNFHLLYKRP